MSVKKNVSFFIPVFLELNIEFVTSMQRFELPFLNRLPMDGFTLPMDNLLPNGRFKLILLVLGKLGHDAILEVNLHF